MGITEGPFQNVVSLFNAGSVATLTGTCVVDPPITEHDVTAGLKTIIITLDGPTWPVGGTPFDNIRQSLIDGMDSAQSETLGWNNEVRDTLLVSAVSRTSDSVATITISVAETIDYEITADETITVTVPAAAMVGEDSDAIATPTFTIADDVPRYTWTYGALGPSGEKAFASESVPFVSSFYGTIGLVTSGEDLDFDNDPVFGGPFGSFWQRNPGGTQQIYTIKDNGDGTAIFYITTFDNNATRSDIATEFGISDDSDQTCTFTEN